MSQVYAHRSCASYKKRCIQNPVKDPFRILLFEETAPSQISEWILNIPLRKTINEKHCLFHLF